MSEAHPPQPPGSHAQSRELRLLAVYPGPALTVDVAAVLLNTTYAQAKTLLQEWARSGLLTDRGRGRYAHRLAPDPGPLPHGEYHRAVEVLLHYVRLRLAAAADRLSPGRYTLDREGALLAQTAQSTFATWWPGPVRWLCDHEGALVGAARLALRHSRHRVLCQITDHLGAVLHALDEGTAIADRVYPWALEAATEEAPAVLALMHQRVGSQSTDRHQALHHAAAAVHHYAVADDDRGLQSAVVDTATALIRSGTARDLTHAQDMLTEAETDLHRFGDRRGAALAALESGKVHAALGDPARALDCFQRAQTLVQGLAVVDDHQLGRCLLAQALLHRAQTRPAPARRAARAALDRFEAAPAPRLAQTARALLTDLDR
ncbi:hypothetical protein [Nocardiopsis sp. CNT312]|uniref:hypothetical protein n=1 Tax=Nocardiopsis sp. CNT312 TaxID=1137268 RepID=UPI00048AE647|nr:hypothetical protein [Nocardiopsis sp. CNT312]